MAMGLFNPFSKKKKDSIELEIDKELPIGTSVNLWLKPNTNIIHIYELGFIGGEGLVGQHENKNLASHLRTNKAFEARVVDFKKISIKLFEKSIEEKLNEEYLVNNHDDLLNELLKPTKINDLVIRLYINEGVDIKKGDILRPIFLNTIEEHLKERILKIEFKNTEEESIGIKENEPNKIRQLLRLNFANKAHLRCEVSNILGNLESNEIEILINRT